MEKKGIEGKNLEEESSWKAQHIERLQRLQAEFENFRKRTQKEKAAIVARARMDILCDFLNLCDVLKEAAQKRNPNENEEVEAYRKGVELILKQFTDFLEKEGVKPIESESQAFNPEIHEAMMTEEGEEDQSGMVAKELQTGYYYQDKVLRPAKVSVYK